MAAGTLGRSESLLDAQRPFSNESAASAEWYAAGKWGAAPLEVDLSTLRSNLLAAAQACADRGLAFAAKWAAENAVALRQPSASAHRRSIDEPSNEADSFLLAKTFFDMREYDRAASVLAKCVEPRSVFLRLYASLVAADCSHAMQPAATFDATCADENPAVAEAAPHAAVSAAASAVAVSAAASASLRTRLLLIEEELAPLADAAHADGFLLYLLAAVSRKLGKRDAAFKLFVKSVKAYPYNWSAWLDLIAIVENHEDLIYIMNQIPRTFMAGCFYCRIASFLNHNMQFILECYNTLEEICPNSRFLQALIGQIYYENSQMEDAIRIFQRLLEKDPHAIDGMSIYSHALLVTGKRTELTALVHKLIMQYRYHPETQIALGNYYSIKRDHARSIKTFQRALKLNPRDTDVYIALGHEYINQNKLDLGIKFFRKAADIAPVNHKTWFNLGFAYTLVRMPLIAIPHFQRAASLRPYNHLVWEVMARAYDNIGNMDNAIRCMKQALLCSPNSCPKILSELGKFHEKLYEETANERVLEYAYYYYARFLEEHDESNDMVADLHVPAKDACQFMVGHYKRQGDLDSAQQFLQRLRRM